jgi:hypothetical protein
VFERLLELCSQFPEIRAELERIRPLAAARQRPRAPQ